MDEGPEPSERAGQDRPRLIVAAVLAVGLVAAVLVVVLAGGGGESDAEAADTECVDAWNDDEAMLAFGLHQFSGHGYERVEVLRVTEDGKPTSAESGTCAVVFAARALDPEPGARAQVLVDGKWTGIESLGNVDDREIAKLQAEAFARVNASLTTDGRIAPSEAQG
ncbi:MAG TPA: hypothetical protein VFY99_01150 [Solirubrobacterales bacterium]